MCYICREHFASVTIKANWNTSAVGAIICFISLFIMTIGIIFSIILMTRSTVSTLLCAAKWISGDRIMIVTDDIHELILNVRQYARKGTIGEDDAIVPRISVTSKHPVLMGRHWPGNNGEQSVLVSIGFLSYQGKKTHERNNITYVLSSTTIVWSLAS